MKQTLLAFLMALVCVGAGCKKETGRPVQPTKFDKAVDGPPSRVMYQPDPNLMRDQAEISRQVAEASRTTPPPATGPSPTTTPATGPGAESRPAAAPAPAPEPPKEPAPL